MSRPSQFSSALSAYLKQNTGNFNRKYGLSAVSPPSSRPSSPLSLRLRENSQFELAKQALSSSPKEFNMKYGFSTRRRKGRKHRKATRKNRRMTRKN